ncbi:hypothetical protein KIH87_18980 [Paraneptunicella aestuarii]|uniref:hypothetical protein n=1 Tax=Paraneptunicella aestuarii TaxID=2831148 RepID=UPI001E5230F2|nr:hypothetical protein [Paraneptunicella aestuarii]UAA38719.1 hypothetical protein KIH87_18980 [Paraneptunicella aestuarii]
MKFSKVTLGLLALLSANTFAATVTINNADFDAQASSDGDIQFAVQSWVSEAGITGIYNPPDTVFTGEAGDGSHKNTLFLYRNAKISQTLSATLEANTDYVLEFDIGERLDYTVPNYTVTVKADDEVLLQSINPIFPSQAGTFSRATLEFGSENVPGVGSNIVIEIETYGDGQAHFDNFSLTSTAGSATGVGGNLAGLGFTTVAHGVTRRYDVGSYGSTITITQNSENNLPYMTYATGGRLQCNEGSVLIEAGGGFTPESGLNQPNIFYQCVLSHQQP